MARARFIPSSLGPVIAGVVLSCMPQCARVVEEDEDTRAAIEEPPRPRVREQPSEATIIDYGPCVSTHSDGSANARPRCVFEPGREFRVWVPPEQVHALEVFVDGQRVPTHPLEPVDDQSRGIGLWLNERSKRFEVGLPGGERWVLALDGCAACHPADDDDDARAKVERYQERLADQGTRIDWRRELLPVLEALQARGLLEKQLGHIDATAYMLSRGHRFDEAAAVLELAKPLVRHSPRLQAMLANSRGQLEWGSGRFGDALVSLRAASLHAVRANETDIAVAALPMYAVLLAEQGYIHAALRWSQRGLELADERGDSCDLAATLRTTGWIQLLLRQQGWSSIDPTLDLEESLAIYGPRGKCPDSSRTGGARLSLALLKLLAGEPAMAHQILGKAKLSRMTPGERVLAIDVGLQAQLALGHPPARIDRTLRRLRRAVEDADTTNAQWHMALRSGQALEARGEHEGAIEAYREAETHVDGLAQLAVFGVGRSTVGTFHRESSDRLVTALLAQHKASEALCVVRRTEARRLQAASLPPTLSVWERRELEWKIDALHRAQFKLDELVDARQAASTPMREEAAAKVARQRQVLESMIEEVLRSTARHAVPPQCSDLHEPMPGELLLGLFPNGDRWLFFAHDSQGTQVHPVDLPEFDYDLPLVRARLSLILLGPVATQLERADRIRVHAVGQAQHIDMDLLPWNGEPLVASKSVAWGVDVAAAAWPVVTGAREARAVLLADPILSLPDAYAEILHAAGTLADTGVLVEVVEPADARRTKLLDQMVDATLLHFAGHADHDMLGDPGLWPPYAGGTPSWPASLLLADDERLGAHEILARPGKVPRKVILSGCSTGALDASAGGTSLAVAFVMAGTEEVLAATGRPNDAEARAVMQQLYDELAGTPLADWSLVDALAAVKSRRTKAGEAEVGYRVLVR